MSKATVRVRTRRLLNFQLDNKTELLVMHLKIQTLQSFFLLHIKQIQTESTHAVSNETFTGLRKSQHISINIHILTSLSRIRGDKT